MNDIDILDCTLRDGGYCNDWKFGEKNIHLIIKALIQAKIDIIECGFLSGKVTEDVNISKFSSIERISQFIPEDKAGSMFVCMINYGDFLLEDIPDYDGSSVDGIRVAFHKHDMHKAVEYCQGLTKKGYKVFVQPMLSVCYSEEEFLQLISLVNVIKPYAFYIVDSFGGMKEGELLKYFYFTENNLDEEVILGFHSHNNMQLAYSNAKTLIRVRKNRKIIIDSSIYGMGRGAGNLNTELIIGYLNESDSRDYLLQPLLIVIDKILNKFYKQKRWGYSIANYISAKYNVHPNYSQYLENKQTLTIEDMDNIFSAMDVSFKEVFNYDYAEKLYVDYLGKDKVNDQDDIALKQYFADKKVLIIAPGKSGITNKEKIEQFVKENDVISVGVNFDYKYLQTDYIFLSNLRRYKELDERDLSRCIMTSNITSNNFFAQVEYSKLLNTVEYVKDNSAMMLIKLLISLGVKKIYIAGLDGYSYDLNENYVEQSMAYIMEQKDMKARNSGMKKVLKEFASMISIEFITTSMLSD